MSDIEELSYYYISSDSIHSIAGFTVDKAFKTRETWKNLPVVDFGNIEKTLPPDQYKLFVALSYSKMNKVREEKVRDAQSKGYKLISYISSKATILNEGAIGMNCFILEKR